MKITDLLDPRSILLDAAPTSKSETLDKAVELMAASEKLSDVEAFRKQVYKREEESTTGIGEGIAIPHGKCDAVKKPGLAAMVIKNGVDFDSLDGEPVTLLFLIAAPNTKDNVHLDVLSKLSVLMMDEEFSDSLRNASSVEEFLSIIDKADAEQADIDDRLAAGSSENGATKAEEQAAESDKSESDKVSELKILAVTSCPTGIAHTYMAAEGLEKAARAKGLKIKIETRGSAGAKNVLTAQEIEACDCIIVAADAQVPMERFDEKRVIECQVSDGISKAPELLERALSGDAPVYHASSAAGKSQKKADSSKSGSISHQIYTQLMNGVSHMLPFVVGGGILIAIAFLIDGFSVDMNSLPIDQRGNFGTITPLAAWFKNVGGVAFGFMLPVLAGFIAMAIGDRPALAVGFVGGMIASQGKSGFLGALAAGEEGCECALHGARHRHATLRRNVRVDECLDKPRRLRLHLGRTVDVRIDGGNAALQRVYLCLDAHRGRFQPGHAHLHVYKLSLCLFFQLCGYGNHLTNGRFPEVGQSVALYRPLRRLVIYRCMFHDYFSVFKTEGQR